MKFQREWYYVLYAVILLTLGLFIERFFCRFLCPLGAFMVIGGKLRLKNPLKTFEKFAKYIVTGVNGARPTPVTMGITGFAWGAKKVAMFKNNLTRFEVISRVPFLKPEHKPDEVAASLNGRAASPPR